MNSLKHEIAFLFSGMGMPYEKVAMLVAVVCAVLFTVLLGNNFIKEAPVAVIDLDNSKYSHELIQEMDASPYIDINTVFHSAVNPKVLFYRDHFAAVVYFPKDLEKNRYSDAAGQIGVFYDNTSIAQNADIMEALNTIVAEENNKLSAPETSRAERGITLRDRLLFNPQGSAANNDEVQGFLFFFSSMFFTFATIGMIPRLRMTGQLAQTMEEGTPFAILSRLVPYCACLMTALTVGMVILHYLNDMAFAGSVWLFFLTQCFYIPAVGVMSLLFGWNAANPGVAASRMILFIPMGFILGGATSPLMEQSLWVRYFAHFFPLTWEYMNLPATLPCAAPVSGISLRNSAAFSFISPASLSSSASSSMGPGRKNWHGRRRNMHDGRISAHPGPCRRFGTVCQSLRKGRIPGRKMRQSGDAADRRRYE